MSSTPRARVLVPERPRSPRPPIVWAVAIGESATGELLWQDGVGVWAHDLREPRTPRLLARLDAGTFDALVAPSGEWFGKPSPTGTLQRYSSRTGEALASVALPPCVEAAPTSFYDLELDEERSLFAGGCDGVGWVATELASPVSVHARTSVTTRSRQSILANDALALFLRFDARYGVQAIDFSSGRPRWTAEGRAVGGAASHDGELVAAVFVGEREGVAVLEGSTGEILGFLESSTAERPVSRIRLGWLPDGSLWVLRPAEYGGSKTTFSLYVVNEHGLVLRSRSDVFDLGDVDYSVAVHGQSARFTVFEPSGAFVTRGPDGIELSRCATTSAGGSACTFASGTSECRGDGCRMLVER